MYCDHFGLRLLPFEDRADPQFYYPTAEGEEALAGLEYAGRYGKRVAIVTGPAGAGKTLLVRTFLQRLHANDHAVVVTIPTGGGGSVIRETAKAFGLTFSSHPTTRRCLARLRKHLMVQSRAEHNSIVIFDQAENLSADDLLKIAGLSELNHNETKLLGIVLVGQPHMMIVLTRPEFARLRQQAFGESVIDNMSADETAGYIRHRLTAAGAADAAAFDEPAMALIHGRTAGNPRLINQVCNACFVAAYGAGAQNVSEEIVREVTRRSPATVDREPRTMPAPPVLVRRERDVDHVMTAQAAASFAAAPASAPAVFASTAAAGPEWDEIPSPPAGRGEDRGYVSAPVNGMTADSYAIADRLEFTLRRAERARAVHETGLAQYAAVEEHLELLSKNAERLAATLPASAQRAGESFDGLQRRGEQVLGRLEQRVAELEARAVRAAAATEEARRADDALRQSSARASATESRLSSFAEELLERMERAQEKLGLLMTAMETGDATCTNLQSLSGDVSKFVSESEARIRALSGEVAVAARDSQASLHVQQAAVEQMVARVGQLRSEFGPEAFEALRSHLKTMLTDIETRQQSCMEQAAARIDQLRADFGAQAVENHRERMKAMLAQVEAEHAAVSGTITKSRGDFATLRADADACAGAARSACAQATSDIKTAEARARELSQRTSNEQQDLATLLDDSRKYREDLVARTHQAEDLAADLSDLTRRGGTMLDETRTTCGRIESVQRTTGHTLVEIGAACERLGAMKEQADASSRTLEELRAEQIAGQRIAQQLAQTVREAAAVKEAVGALTRDAYARSEQIESHHAAGQALLRQLTEANQSGQRLIRQVEESTHAVQAHLAACEGRVHAIARTVESSEQSVADRTKQADSLAQRVESAVVRGTSLVDEARTVLDRLDGAQRGAAGALVEVGGACERLAALRAEAERSAKIADDLASRRIEAEAAGEGLTATIAGVRASSAEGTRLLAQIAERLAAVEGASTGAEETVSRLIGARSKALQAVERIETSTAGTDSRLAELHATAQQVERLVAQGGDIASSLASLRGDGEVCIDAIDRRTQEAAAARAQLEQAVQEIGSLSAAGEDRLTRFAREHERADALLARLLNSTGSFETISVELAGLLGAADDRVHGLQAGVAQAGAAATQLEAERRGAESLLHNLDEVGHHAADLAGQLDDGARKIADTLSQADGIGQRLCEQESSVEAGERLMRELIHQAEEAAARLGALDTRAGQVEQKIEQALTHPREVIVAAQAQAAKLETVCSAVRKIFAGLAKTALESQQHRDDFDKVSREAAQRLTLLKTETERTIGTLQQWVAEASRAQDRLAQTLTRVPSIAQTHPPDALAGLLRAGGAVGEIVSKPRAAEFRRMSAPQAAAGEGAAVGAPSTDPSPTPRTRAEEIARMIEDAKKAANA